MTIETEIFPDADSLGRRAAELVAEGIAEAAEAGRPFLLGCPGGRSASSTYRALALLVAARKLDLSHVAVVMMDDYLVPGPDGSLVHEDAAALHSCVRFGVEEIIRPLAEAAGQGIGTPELWVPDPAEPEAYDDRIAAAGGIDLFLLASGAGDGHVAFNGPGSPADSPTRIVELPEQTRRDNLATFPSFDGRLDRVPRHGVTVGIDTIVRHSASAIMLVHGADKGLAARHLLAADGYDPAWPATVVAVCARPRLFLDEVALAAARAMTATTPSAP
ncbi:6-phosphogluconolactonase [uncultured Friedmanniella sp.]|uniref:6-phosphogluconolactonase n=1 Tax=uncultured Friedmanniella sp. TaxID=335381 RepID=UPI0035CB9AAA